VVAPLAVVSFVVSLVAGASTSACRCGDARRWAARRGGGNGLLVGVERDASFLRLLPGLAVVGAGVGLVNPLATFAHLGVMSPAHGGLAAPSTTPPGRCLAIGIAALGALVERSLPAAARGDAYALAFTTPLATSTSSRRCHVAHGRRGVGAHRTDDMWSAPPPAPSPPREPAVVGAA
jgi:hypothetical protein